PPRCASIWHRSRPPIPVQTRLTHAACWECPRALTLVAVSLCRGRLWLRLGGGTALLQPRLETPDLFVRLLGVQSVDETSALESTGVEGEVARDVDRTFPTMELFAPENDGQRQLGNVLKAVALHAQDVGYCQGMNYVAAVLLLMMDELGVRAQTLVRGYPPQELAFWVVIAFIRRMDMAETWKTRMPGLSRCIYQYNELLRVHFRDLHAHLKQIGVHPSMLVTQWFVTLFARTLSVGTLARLWDLFLLDGWKMVYRVTLALTAQLRPRLLEMDMEEFSEYVRKNPRMELDAVDPETLIAQAFTFKITRRVLTRMEGERHLEYLRLRLQKTPISVENSVMFPALDEAATDEDKQRALNVIRDQLAHFDTDVASDMTVLRRKIEAADKSIAQATSVLFRITYEATEATFQLEERLELRRRLKGQYDEFAAMAIAEATSSSPSVYARERNGAGALARWNPLATLVYINSRMYVCLERVIPKLSQNAATPHSRERLDSDEENERNLVHLETLVPRLAADLHAIQRKINNTDKDLRGAQQRYTKLMQTQQLARVELEEAQQFKDRVADQMLQLMFENERQKNAKMQQLFAQVDEGSARTTKTQPSRSLA
ncbi:TPA: hypothetical protein N0F65_006136, partial [Lagenidium giganteum]